MLNRAHPRNIRIRISLSKEIYVSVFDTHYTDTHNPQMPVDFQRLTIDALAAGKAAEPGYKQETLANAAGTSQAIVSRWTKGSVPEDKHRAGLFAEARRLGLNLADYGSDDGSAPVPRVAAGRQLVGAPDLPVYAAAQGGKGHIIVTFEPIRFVKRPHVLLDVPGGYGILVIDDSMKPAHRHNSIALVNPARHAQPGDEVVLFHVKPEGESEAMIKLLNGITSKKLKLEQYHPAKKFEVDQEDWPVRHVVVGNYKFW
jgi:hypothetical protein